MSRQFSPKTHPAKDLLVSIGRNRLDLWKRTDWFRSKARQTVNWPEWSFLPLGAAQTIVGDDIHDSSAVSDMGSEAFGVAGVISALAAWRVTQGIYRFDPALYESLIATPISGDLPIDPFFRLPEWCLYLETPSLELAGLTVHGVWVQLTIWGEQMMPVLQILPNVGRGGFAHSIYLSLTAGGVRDGMAALLGEENSGPLELFVHPVVCLALYLCADNAEIGDGNRRPKKPKPKGTRDGWRMFPANAPTTWDVGVRIGAALRKAYHEAETASGETTGTGTSPRPHIRRAHWHGFWTGPRNTQEERKLALKWLPPIPVRVDSVDDLPAVIRPVLS